MMYELIFSLVGLLSFVGWGALLASPWMPLWSDRIAGWIIPVMLAVAYIIVALVAPPEDGGFGSFEEVQTLFSFPGAVLSGWIHFLVFDLMVGAWVCRTARSRGIPFWLVLPCLPVVFLFGPAGLLLFGGVVGVHRVVHWTAERRELAGGAAD